ncbi:MAG: SDR family NAD(P)-dependent oxidoreductase [Chlorobi bacterium]|nr:SDR family NAD(P)-dependent oxidoreductase [Chlorobiota bacterium]
MADSHKKVAFITGSSKGIGKSLAEILLNNGFFVIGIARHQTINHPSYSHIALDLSDVSAVLEFSFPTYESVEKLVLVNNAATLGHVAHTGDIENNSIPATINVNLTSPLILINKFVGTYRSNKAEKVIINISTGAAFHPVDGWLLYCSSKAGLEMATHVVNEDLRVTEQKNFHVFSVLPGIVDTEMQRKIRSVPETHFSRKQEFVEYKQSGQLRDPHEVAEKIYGIIDKPYLYSEETLRV